LERCHGAGALEEGRPIVDGTGGYRGAGTDELRERDHELRASLCGIEAVAVALNEQRDRLACSDVDQLVLAIASESRRLRLMLEPPAKQCGTFDLAEAIGPAVLMIRSLGVVVRDAVPTGMLVQGSRDDLAEVVFALLDNARVHAAPSAIDVRATSRKGTTTLYVEDRGPGITRLGCRLRFKRGRPVGQSSGSGLGLSIARRLMIDQSGSLTVHARHGGGASIALSLPSSPPNTLELVPRVALRPAVVR
jgi:signal transduction histidine kinase